MKYLLKYYKRDIYSGKKQFRSSAEYDNYLVAINAGYWWTLLSSGNTYKVVKI